MCSLTPSITVKETGDILSLEEKFQGGTSINLTPPPLSIIRHINGFAATFDDETAIEISKHPNVLSIFLNQGRKLHTTRSWDFLGLERNGGIRASSLWKKSQFGEDTITANLDTIIVNLIFNLVFFMSTFSQ
ncbi:hypothetical protein ACS0TY_007097 [Phlomoides rotata]